MFRRVALVALVACTSSEDPPPPPAPVVTPPPRDATIVPDAPVDAGIASPTNVGRAAPPEAVRRAIDAPTIAELVEGGQHWRLATEHGPVHVWIPHGFRPKRAETVVYVHGYYIHVDDAWKTHRLDQQFASSTIDAMFIACEAPAGGDEAVSWPSIKALLDAVEKGIAQPTPRRRIVAIGHSGAYRTLLEWLDEPVLDTVVLLDAAYGEIESYRSWVLAAKRHRLIDVGDDTKQWTEQLHKELTSSVILDKFPSVEDEIPKAAAKAKILYIRSNLGHFPLITGGVALPMVLRTLRAKKLLDVPLAELLPDK